MFKERPDDHSTEFGGEDLSSLASKLRTFNAWRKTHNHIHWLPHLKSMNPWAWALIRFFYCCQEIMSLIHSLSHRLLDHYFTPSPQNPNTSSTIFILSSWPCFLPHCENGINQKRPSMDSTGIWFLVLPLVAIDEHSMLLTRVISSICAIGPIPLPLLKAIAPAILYLSLLSSSPIPLPPTFVHPAPLL